MACEVLEVSASGYFNWRRQQSERPTGDGPHSNEAALVTALGKAHLEGRLDERIAQYATPKLPIVDELGDLPFEPAAAHLFVTLGSG